MLDFGKENIPGIQNNEKYNESDSVNVKNFSKNLKKEDQESFINLLNCLPKKTR